MDVSKEQGMLGGMGFPVIILASISPDPIPIPNHTQDMEHMFVCVRFHEGFETCPQATATLILILNHEI